MQLQDTEAQALLRRSLRELLEREASFDRLRDMDRAGDWDRQLWALLHSGGWLALPFPVEDGGEGGSLTDVAIVVEELAGRAVRVPYLETVVCALSAGNSSLQHEVMSGGTTVAPALYDADDDPSGTSARVDGEGRLTAFKQGVDYPESNLHAVSTSAGLALVAADSQGLSLAYTPHIGRTPKAQVTYEAVPAQLVDGSESVSRILSMGTAFAAVQSLGLAATALDMTLTYVANRVQFGRPIGTFQAVQHECADMATMLEITRFLVYETVSKLAAATARSEDIAVAKSWASRAAVDVTLMAHQLHGGIGVTEEYNLNFFSRRAKERALAWSTETECLRVLAGTAHLEEAWI